MVSFLRSFIFPTVRAQEEEAELVDPQAALREKCGEKPKLVALHEKLEQCNERVSSKKQTTETCTEELIDYFHELDHCVAKTLFTKLK